MAKCFDVFLSHNSKDKPAVRELAEALRARGLKVWLDEWELVPGLPWQEALEEVIETTGSAAVLVGKDGLGPWQDLEMRGCLFAFVERKLPVIPVLLPGTPEVPKLPFFLKPFTWVDLRGGLTEEEIDRLQWGVTGKRPDRSKKLLSAPTVAPGGVAESVTQLSSAELKPAASEVEAPAALAKEDQGQKPAAGTLPAFVSSEIGSAQGLSTAAAKIAIEFVRRSENGRYGDPGINVEELLSTTELLEDDLAEGVEELEARGLVKSVGAAGFALGFYAVVPTSNLFAELDPGVKEDALRLAADLVNGEGHISVPNWAEEVGWKARRVNPAITYLAERGLVEHSNEVSRPFISNHLSKNARTRRFVRQGT